MSLSDPLGDMLTRIRNAQRARQTRCVAPASKLRANVLEVLKREGTIASIAPHVPSFQEFFDLVGMQEVRSLEGRYGVPDDARVNY